MTLKVITTNRSRKTLSVIYKYIAGKFGINSANKFLVTVDKTVAQIAMQPYMFKATRIDEQVRVGFITKQCSLIYRVTDTEIHLLYFWDNRQDPILP